MIFRTPRFRCWSPRLNWATESGGDGDDLVVEALVAFTVGVVVHAVQQVVVEHAALTVDVIRALADETADGTGGGGSRRLTGTGDQPEQIREVAADQRQRFGLIVGDVLAALAGLCFEL
jgi:hypothetical protein